MPARITITPGEVFNSLRVIREVEKLKTGKEFKRAVEVECICGHIFIVRYNAIKMGSTTSCGCLKSRYVTSANRDRHLTEVFKETSIKRADSLPIENGPSKVNLRCEVCNHVWKRDFNTIATKKIYCPSCEGNLRMGAKIDYKQPVLDKLIGTKLSLYSEIDSRLERTDSVLLKCGINNCIFKRRVDVILGYNYSCPCQSSSGFKSTNPAVLYLLELKDENNVINAYKYGITNNFQQRLQQIKRKYPNTLDTFYVWEYRYGSTANDHERVIKHSLVAVHDKSSMPDGFTETFGKEMLSAFLAIQQSQYEREVYY